MFNIFEKLFPKKNYIFYDYFKESAETCKQAATLFLKILENGVMEEYDQKAYASSQKWLNKLREKYPESTVLAEYQTKLNAVQQK